MIRAPPERNTMESPVKIIRYSEPIKFESGVISNMQCMGGTLEEVKKYAEQTAKENGVEVAIVI